MSDAQRYFVPADQCRAEETIDRSRFVCTLAPAESVDAAQAFIGAMRTAHGDATHNCWAYVVGPPGSTARLGMSDDGEPHGTAGRPMLTVLLHSGIGDIVAVVTRYYGGTKLGTGGLARAYGAAVQGALAILPRRERVAYGQLTVTVTYSYVSVILRLLPDYEADIIADQYLESVTLDVRAPIERLVALRAAVSNATNGQATFADADVPPL